MLSLARLSALALLAIVALIGHACVLDHQKSQAAESLHRLLDSRVAALTALVGRYETLPEIVALDRRTSQVLDPEASAVDTSITHVYLTDIAARAGVEAIFVLDRNGVVISSSNHGAADSFVGERYAFRPYFTAALAGSHGRFFGVGATTGRPGYFLSAPVHLRNRIVGVLVVKVGIDTLEAPFRGTDELLVVHDEHGVVVLTSDIRLRYRTVAPLSDAQRDAIDAARQYGSLPLVELPSNPLKARHAGDLRDASGWRGRLDPTRVHRPIAELGWTAVAFESSAAAHAVALLTACAVALAGVAVIGVVGFAKLARQRRQEMLRRDTEIAARIAQGTHDLRRRVAEQERTERLLREATDSSVQAGKLIVLGQMAAGLSHELTQPLLAMKTYVSNTRLLNGQGRADMVARNLLRIEDLVGRMEQIVLHLRAHARKQSDPATPVEIAGSLQAAAELLRAARTRQPILSILVDPPELQVMAEPVRLEQVLLNLLRNAAEASPGQGTVVVRATACSDSQATIEVADSGPGISASAMPHLFEPFYTTKAKGDGLGLGLAVSKMIVERFGGHIEADNRPGGGAVFRVTLPRPTDTSSPLTQHDH